MVTTKRSPEEMSRQLWDALRSSLRDSRDRGEPFAVAWPKALRAVAWSKHNGGEGLRGLQYRELVDSTAAEWQAAYEGVMTPTARVFADLDAASRIVECIVGVERIAV